MKETHRDFIRVIPKGVFIFIRFLAKLIMLFVVLIFVLGIKFVNICFIPVENLMKKPDSYYKKVDWYAKNRFLLKLMARDLFKK